jgi:uncharacterized protein (DUF2141 family)
MKNIITVLTLVLLAQAPQLFSQTQKVPAPLTFEVCGFADNLGQVIVQLFRQEDDVPVKPFLKGYAKIANNKSVVEFEKLPYGDYAAIIVHDKNSNGIVDHRWGMPDEPLGYTNNWELSFLSGMPSFDKLKFEYSASKQKYFIKMNE